MNGQQRRIVFMLRQDGYREAAELIESLLGRFNLPKELDHLTEFAVSNDSGSPLARDQLRALWTAYCFHAGLLPDTAPYDNTLLHIWNRMEQMGQTRGWKDFDDFDNAMGAYLV